MPGSSGGRVSERNPSYPNPRPEVAPEAKPPEPNAPQAKAPDARAPDPKAPEPKTRDASAPTPAYPKLSLKGRDRGELSDRVRWREVARGGETG